MGQVPRQSSSDNGDDTKRQPVFTELSLYSGPIMCISSFILYFKPDEMGPSSPHLTEKKREMRKGGAPFPGHAAWQPSPLPQPLPCSAGLH